MGRASRCCAFPAKGKGAVSSAPQSRLVCSVGSRGNEYPFRAVGARRAQRLLLHGAWGQVMLRRCWHTNLPSLPSLDGLALHYQPRAFSSSNPQPLRGGRQDCCLNQLRCPCAHLIAVSIVRGAFWLTHRPKPGRHYGLSKAQGQLLSADKQTEAGISTA